MNARQQRIIGTQPGTSLEIGRWLWCLEETRKRTMERVNGFDSTLLDWRVPESGNSVGTVLYHIALVELDYLYNDLLGQSFPQDVVDLFPYAVREEGGRLTPIARSEFAWYVNRLDFADTRVREIARAMVMEDFRRERQLRDRPVDLTPEWTLFHLTQHEAEHRGELAAIRARAEAVGRD